jgi:hypothetical protein
MNTLLLPPCARVVEISTGSVLGESLNVVQLPVAVVTGVSDPPAKSVPVVWASKLSHVRMVAPVPNDDPATVTSLPLEIVPLTDDMDGAACAEAVIKTKMRSA